MANKMTALIPQARIESFRSTMRGEVLEPSNPAYDATRVVWNGMIDRRPALIARCANAADVAASVNFARDQGFCNRDTLGRPQCCRLCRLRWRIDDRHVAHECRTRGAWS